MPVGSASRLFQSTGLVVAVAIFGVAALSGQSTAPAKPPTAAQAAAAALSALRNQPKEFVAALVDYVARFPDTDTAEDSAFMLRYSIPKEYSSAELPPLVATVIDAFGKTSVPLRVHLYSDLCSFLATRQLWPELSDVAGRAIPLVDEQRYVEFERHRYERQVAAAKERNPEYKPSPFREAETQARVLPFKASLYAYEARGFVEQGKLEEADAAFHQAYAIRITTESAWGLGTVLERRGKEAEALPYLTTAFLTGKLKAPDIQHFNALFARLRPGENVERYLDAEFLRSYSNPIPEQKYTPTSRRSDRTVLAEFFTGGGCVPCIPFDYAFERVLDAYSSDEVVVLVNHWHAPSIDPLGNHGVDSRVKLYGVTGAPTTIVQGRRLSTRDDNASEAEKAVVAPRVFRQIQALIDPALETPAGAALAGTATRAGDAIDVTVIPSRFAKTGGRVRLQIALVEKRVSYSGENGLRMQMNVVRNLAGSAKPAAYGFAVDTAQPAPVHYIFDLQQITAENLRYYDEYPEERKAEIVAEGRASVISMLTFDWREHKNVMDPANLVVAAFLQDENSKEILQALLIPVR